MEDDIGFTSSEYAVTRIRHPEVLGFFSRASLEGRRPGPIILRGPRMSVQAYEVRRVMRGRLRMTVIGLYCCPALGGTSGFAGAPLRKTLNGIPVTANECFFLCSAPALQLTLCRDCVGDPVEVL
jgi:hypothetical protein